MLVHRPFMMAARRGSNLRSTISKSSTGPLRHAYQPKTRTTRYGHYHTPIWQTLQKPDSRRLSHPTTLKPSHHRSMLTLQSWSLASLKDRSRAPNGHRKRSPSTAAITSRTTHYAGLFGGCTYTWLRFPYQSPHAKPHCHNPRAAPPGE